MASRSKQLYYVKDSRGAPCRAWLIWTWITPGCARKTRRYDTARKDLGVRVQCPLAPTFHARLQSLIWCGEGDCTSQLLLCCSLEYRLPGRLVWCHFRPHSKNVIVHWWHHALWFPRVRACHMLYEFTQTDAQEGIRCACRHYSFLVSLHSHEDKGRIYCLKTSLRQTQFEWIQNLAWVLFLTQCEQSDLHVTKGLRIVWRICADDLQLSNCPSKEVQLLYKLTGLQDSQCSHGTLEQTF